jgi:DNA-binding MarR family transcriptional regulator
VDIAERLYVGLVHAAAALRAVDAELGLSPSRSSTLATLRYAGPLRLGELARREGVSQPTMTQAVQAMEAAGLVVRAPAEGDGRGCVVSITPSGRALVRRARARKIALARAALDRTDGDPAGAALLAAVEALGDGLSASRPGWSP